MSERPLLYDVFSGGGGATAGYVRAGFRVIGIDNRPQPRYLRSGAEDFIQMDAFEFFERCESGEYPMPDAWHCSPPCQGYSRMRHLPWLKGREYPLLIDATRDALDATGRVWVIENVEGAPLRSGITLCGLSFGLRMYRHRRFESNVLLLAPPHQRHIVTIGAGRMLGSRYSRASAGATGMLPDPCGHTAGASTKAAAVAMGVEWMTRDEMTQAIPPAYTRHIGTQLLRVLQAEPIGAGS